MKSFFKDAEGKLSSGISKAKESIIKAKEKMHHNNEIKKSFKQGEFSNNNSRYNLDDGFIRPNKV